MTFPSNNDSNDDDPEKPNPNKDYNKKPSPYNTADEDNNTSDTENEQQRRNIQAFMDLPPDKRALLNEHDAFLAQHNQGNLYHHSNELYPTLPEQNPQNQALSGYSFGHGAVPAYNPSAFHGASISDDHFSPAPVPQGGTTINYYNSASNISGNSNSINASTNMNSTNSNGNPSNTTSNNIAANRPSFLPPSPSNQHGANPNHASTSSSSLAENVGGFFGRSARILTSAIATPFRAVGSAISGNSGGNSTAQTHNTYEPSSSSSCSHPPCSSGGDHNHGNHGINNVASQNTNSTTASANNNLTGQTSNLTGQAVPPDGSAELDDCAICMEPIDTSQAVMRCKTRPRCHYFHAECLQEWVRNARANNQRPSCPVCRQDVEFNSRNLRTFLNGDGSSTLTSEERGFFQSISENLNAKADEAWSHVTWDNVQYAGGLIACFGWGFYTGANSDRIYYNGLDMVPMSRHNRMAQGAGWVAGLLWREFKKHQDRKDREGDRR